MNFESRLPLPLTLTLSPQALGIDMDRASQEDGPRANGEREAHRIIVLTPEAR